MSENLPLTLAVLILALCVLYVFWHGARVMVMRRMGATQSGPSTAVANAGSDGARSPPPTDSAPSGDAPGGAGDGGGGAAGGD